MNFVVLKKMTLKGWRWYWRLVAANGRIVCVSGERFNSLAAAQQNIELVRGVSASTPVDCELA